MEAHLHYIEAIRLRDSVAKLRESGSHPDPAGLATLERETQDYLDQLADLAARSARLTELERTLTKRPTRIPLEDLLPGCF